jgi:hypothetical protein
MDMNKFTLFVTSKVLNLETVCEKSTWVTEYNILQLFKECLKKNHFLSFIAQMVRQQLLTAACHILNLR